MDEDTAGAEQPRRRARQHLSVRSLFLALGIAVASPCGAAAAAEHDAERPPPGHTRTVSATPTTTAPIIDGMLDEAVWQSAVRADRFWNSAQERWPAERTEVLAAADATHLYFAFKVYDSRPDEIEALQTRRDADLGLDDQVAVVLDPFLSYRELSTYRVNAIGTQRDEIGGGRARQAAWKGQWKAATRRTEFGWVAEIAIPFDILNFPPGATTLGVNFVRYHHRSREWSSWADLTVRNLPEEMGRLTGLKPDVAAKHAPWTFLPYVLAGHNVPDRKGNTREWLADAGVDIRFQPQPNLTGVLSIRPDFSQVERAVTDIDFSYTEKYRADNRPFFQEGAAYFGEDRAYFYSNRVPNFDVAIKGFGRTDANRFGALAVRSPDARSDVVLDYSRQFDATHYASAIVVGTDRPDLRNQLYAVKGRGRETSGLEYALDAATTRTDPVAQTGSFTRGLLGWGNGFWSLSGTADRYGRYFNPANGLLASDLPDTSGQSAALSYYQDRPEGFLREVIGTLSYEQRDTGDGRLQRRRTYVGGSVEMREQQVRIGANYYAGPYRPNAGAPGVWSEELNHDHYWNGLLEFNTRSSRFGYGVSYSDGFLGGDDYRYLTAYAWARPTPTTVVNVTTEYLENFGTYRQTILTGGWDVTPAHTLSGRFIDAYYGREYRLAYTWRPRTNIDFFLVGDRLPGQATQVSAKLLFTL